MVTIPKLAKKGKVDQVTIPEPYENVQALYRTVLAMKELVEMLAGQRGQAFTVAVTWQDMLDLQLVRVEDIPYDLGSHPFQRPK